MKLDVKRSKVKVTRPINAVTDNAAKQHTHVGWNFRDAKVKAKAYSIK